MAADLRDPIVTELHLDHVSKSFGSRAVLHAVCAEVRHGEVLVVTGHNGSGKSTLLTIIAGLARADSGVVRFLANGQTLAWEDRRLFVGMVAPDLTLYPELTAQENLEFFATVRSLTWSARHTTEALEQVGLAGRGEDLVGTFSSGMRIRLKYAVALQPAPAFLLLDEPTAMLDAGGIEVVQRIIEDQRKRGILVLATNDPQETRHGDLFLHLG